MSRMKCTVDMVRSGNWRCGNDIKGGPRFAFDAVLLKDAGSESCCIILPHLTPEPTDLLVQIGLKGGRRLNTSPLYSDDCSKYSPKRICIHQSRGWSKKSVFFPLAIDTSHLLLFFTKIKTEQSYKCVLMNTATELYCVIDCGCDRSPCTVSTCGRVRCSH